MLTVSADIETETVVMAVHGNWDRSLGAEAHRTLKKCMSEHPATLIIDLQGMYDPHAASLPAWLAARRVGQAMNPPVRVLVCASTDTVLVDRLRRIGAPRYLPVCLTVDQARADSYGSRRSSSRRRLHLPGEVEAASEARALVTELCAQWQMPTLLHRSRLVVSELVANAALHARTPMTVLVSRRSAGIHLVVADGDPRLPQPPAPRATPAPLRLPEVLPPSSADGHGLQLVDAAATVWGALPTPEGKMVWATLHPWARRR
ncbi:ATP-binding protein [Actinoplanes sp. NPDC051859]|uniref:ATP-binding protein n=1 Tax=Actinoplanes sp. NPDC051859 TaxID=3363909 RepID=UPI0037A0296B